MDMGPGGTVRPSETDSASNQPSSWFGSTVGPQEITNLKKTRGSSAKAPEGRAAIPSSTAAIPAHHNLFVTVSPPISRIIVGFLDNKDLSFHDPLQKVEG